MGEKPWGKHGDMRRVSQGDRCPLGDPENRCLEILCGTTARSQDFLSRSEFLFPVSHVSSVIWEEMLSVRNCVPFPLYLFTQPCNYMASGGLLCSLGYWYNLIPSLFSFSNRVFFGPSFHRLAPVSVSPFLPFLAFPFFQYWFC